MTAKQPRSAATRLRHSPAKPHITPSMDVLSHDDALLPAVQSDLPIPLTSRAVFWRPRHNGGEGTMLHQPFLFWLAETARPTRVVQIGLAEPVRFLSLCQAVEKLGMEALCMGVVVGEEAQGFNAAQLDQHATLYGDFSFVTSEDMARATRHVHGQDVDLLVIDMPLNDEQVAALRTHWVPLLSDRALIVVHDPEGNLAGSDARQYFDGLAQANSSISFSHTAPGLQVILHGNKQPERLLRLADLELGMPGYLLARQVFARLGQGLENAQLARRAQDSIKKEKAATKALEQKIAGLEEKLTNEKTQRNAAQTAEERQVSLIAGLQARIFDLETQLGQRPDVSSPGEIDSIRAEMEALKTAAAAEAQRRDKLQKMVKTLEEEKATLTVERDRARGGRRREEQQRVDEIAALQQSHAQEIDALRLDMAKHAGDREAFASGISDLEKEKAELFEKVQSLSSAVEAFDRQKAELEAAKSAETQRRDKLQKMVKALEEEKATLTLERDRARSGRKKEEQQRLEEVAALQASHRKELDALKMKLGQQAAEREPLAKAVSALEQEKVDLKETVSKLSLQLKQSQAKRLAIWEERQALKSRLDALSGSDGTSAEERGETSEARLASHS